MEDLLESGELGSQRKEENRNKSIKRRRSRLREALRWIVGDERGRLYLADIVRESHALERVQCATADLVMFVDGQRSMGFKVLNDLRGLGDASGCRHFAALCASVLVQPKEDPNEQ
jgi:hypothetical protein